MSDNKNPEFKIKNVQFLSMDTYSPQDSDRTYFNANFSLPDGRVLRPTVAEDIASDLNSMAPRTDVEIVFSVSPNQYEYNKPKLEVQSVKASK